MKRHRIAAAMLASSCRLGAAGTHAGSATVHETYHTSGLIGAAAPAGATRVVIVRRGPVDQTAVDADHPRTTIVVKPGTYAEHVVITADGIKLLGQGATLVLPGSSAAECRLVRRTHGGGLDLCGRRRRVPGDAPSVVTDPLSNVRISGFTVSGLDGTVITFLGARSPGDQPQLRPGQRGARHRPLCVEPRADRRQLGERQRGSRDLPR
jgi:hypothetical protein